MNYIEVYFEPVDENLTGLLVAELTLAGAESFWQDSDRLRAYFTPVSLDKNQIQNLADRYSAAGHHLHYGIQQITSKSWDVAQDDSFEPIVIGNQCRVRGSKDKVADCYPYELVVNPSLSFGSGHHPSTSLCLAMQLEMDFQGKAVLDIGCGSGILSLLAEKLGAVKIDAIDNNPWATEVAGENFHLNNSRHINLQEADISSADIASTYPIVLANLNAPVLLCELPRIAASVEKGGELVISGYMEKDEQAIHALAHASALKLKKIQYKNQWIAALFEKE